MDKEIIVKLVYNDKKTRNNTIMPLEEFKKSVNNDYTQRLLKTGSLYVKNTYEMGTDMISHVINKPDLAIGNIISIDTEKMEATIKADEIYEDDSFGLFLAYTCNCSEKNEDGVRIVKDARILYSVLQPKALSAYL